VVVESLVQRLMDSRALAGELPPVVGENGDVGRLAVKVHSDVDDDRASLLSFVLSDATASSSEHGSGGGTTREQAAEQRSSCPNGRPMYDELPLTVRAPIS
jgi:hypothetical protein